MEFRNLKLELNCKFTSNTMKIKSYILVTLFHDHCTTSNFVKHIANLDTEGNTILHFTDVDVERASICIQVFNQRRFLPDKCVAKVDARVSQALKIDTTGARDATFELGTALFCVPRKSVLKLSYNLLVLDEVVAPNSSSAAAIGSDVGLFKTVPSFRTPIVSFNWSG